MIQYRVTLTDDIFKWIFLNENMWISIRISLKFVPRGPINNIPVLAQIMAWHRPMIAVFIEDTTSGKFSTTDASVFR